MSGTPETIALLAIVFGPMLVEAGRAARNERVQRARGGIEPPGDVYAVMRVAYPGVFLVMIAEGAWRHSQAPAGPFDARLAAAGLALFLAAKALKWWAIASLGPSWTFRVIVVPGDAPVASGPVRVAASPQLRGCRARAGGRRPDVGCPHQRTGWHAGVLRADAQAHRYRGARAPAAAGKR